MCAYVGNKSVIGERMKLTKKTFAHINVEREFLGKFSVDEFIARIVRFHLEECYQNRMPAKEVERCSVIENPLM